MKRNHHFGWAVPLVITVALYTFNPGISAQSPGSSPQQEQPQQQTDQQESKTFTGKVMKLQNGNFALVTGQSEQGQASGHFLDNQDEAKKYEGKQVTVTGTLEVASNTIHVTKIEAAA